MTAIGRWGVLTEGARPPQAVLDLARGTAHAALQAFGVDAIKAEDVAPSAVSAPVQRPFPETG